MNSPSGRLESESESGDEDHGQDESSRDRFRPALGSVLLFLGIGLMGLLAVERDAGLPVRMPRSWYIDRGLWVAIGLLAFGAGWRLLGDRKLSEEESRTKESGSPGSSTEQSGVRFERVVLYTRPGCHLCDLARQTLAKYPNSLPRPSRSISMRTRTAIPFFHLHPRRGDRRKNSVPRPGERSAAPPAD